MNAAKKAAALSQLAVAGMRATTELDALDIYPAYLAKDPVIGRSDHLAKSLRPALSKDYTTWEDP